MTIPPRKPQAFILKNSPVDTETNPQQTEKIPAKDPAIDIAYDTDDITALAPLNPVAYSKPLPYGTYWGWLIASLFCLICLWAGLGIVELVETFFNRAAWLGFSALALALIAGASLLALIMREIWGLFRLRQIEHLQPLTKAALLEQDQAKAYKALQDLKSLYANRPDMRWPLSQLADLQHEIMTDCERLQLAEQFLLPPLDHAVQAAIAKRARRVTLLTTLTPVAALDMLFVATQNLAMLREIAGLYGGRPSTLATFKLAKQVVTHLAVTGGLALSDNFLQFALGKGIIGRLSTRFGEGAVNGMMTARIGLAAQDICRPLPLNATRRETLAQILKEVLSLKPSAKTKERPLRPDEL